MPLRSNRKKSPARTVTSRKSLSRVTSSTSTAYKDAENEMEFEVNAPVLARWPGTSLYYKAVVSYVRQEDNEYDVKYEDGTIFTIKARDVMKPSAIKRRVSRGRSKSRTREVTSKKNESKEEKPEIKEEKTKTRSRKTVSKVTKSVDSETDEGEDEKVKKVESRRKTMTKSNSLKTISKTNSIKSSKSTSLLRRKIDDDIKDFDIKTAINNTNSIKRSTLSLTNIKPNHLTDSDDEDDKVVSFNSSYNKKLSHASLDTPLFSTRFSSMDNVDSLGDKAPTRMSARIASKLVELSSDDERPKLAPNPEIRLRQTKKPSFWSRLNFEWLSCLFFMVLGAFILLSLHLLCKSGSCKPAIPKVPQKLKSYWDPYSLGLILAEILIISVLSLVPIGPLMKNVNGQNIRKNGFLTLLACLALLPVLVVKQVDIEFVQKRYFRLMISSFGLGVFASICSFAYSYISPGPRSIKNTRGNTGNAIVDFFHGRELNPTFWKFDLKLQTFRYSMITLALINAVLIGDYVMKNNENASPLVVCAAAFQILYALDALFFEDFYFYSHDAMNNGYGYSIIVSYYTLPFLPTLIVRYLLANSPVEAPWYVIAGIVLVNMVGYMIFRSSENQRCLFKMNPDDEGIKHLDRMTSSSNKKILSGSWWSLVRYPNYLGEVLIQWSWVLPAVMVAGKTDVLVYYLPMFVTLVLLVRCSEQNSRNRQMYGVTWDKYCQKVKSNIFPKIF